MAISKAIRTFTERKVVSTFKGWKKGMRSSTAPDLMRWESHNQVYKNGQVGMDVYEYYTEIKEVLPDGTLVPGKLVLGTTKFVKFVPYMNTGMSRLDNGFSALLDSFKASGVSQHALNRLLRKWNSLSDNQKARVFNSYRMDTYDADYGSDAYDERALMSFDKDSTYAGILEDCIDDELGIPIEERSYEY